MLQKYKRAQKYAQNELITKISKQYKKNILKIHIYQICKNMQRSLFEKSVKIAKIKQ